MFGKDSEGFSLRGREAAARLRALRAVAEPPYVCAINVDGGAPRRWS